jgi:hypothetical protein
VSIDALTILSGGTNLTNIFSQSDTTVTGLTFNPTTYDLTVSQDNGKPSYTSNLAALASDIFVLSGVYDISTGIVTYTTNSGSTFQVSGFTSGMTDSYTSAASLNGNVIEFDNNIQGTNLYSVDLTSILSGKTNNSDFWLHTGDTNNPHQTSFSNLVSTGHTHILSEITDFSTYSGSVQTQIDNIEDNYVTGATMNSNTLELSRSGGLSDVTVDLSQFVDDTNDGVVSGATMNGNILELSRTEGLGLVSVDLNQFLDNTDRFVTGATMNSNTLELSRSGGLSDVTVDLSQFVDDTNDGVVTGATMNSNTLELSRTQGLGVVSVDLSQFLDNTNNYVTGFTYNNSNTLIVSVNDGSDYNVTINEMSGLTVNGDLKATTLYSGDTELSDIFVLTSEVSGVWGISDSNGAYTYYDTIALANAAASAGDTVEMFSNVNETGAVEWILKDGVNYNLNGHTYENSNSGTTNTVDDNNVSTSCIIMNGIIKRSGGATTSLTSNVGLYIANSSSRIQLDGVTVYNTNGLSTRISTSARVTGGRHISDAYYSVIVYGIAIDMYAYTGSGGNDCFFNASGQMIRCTGVSDGADGIYVSNTGKLIDCTGYSTASAGIRHTGSRCVMQGCKGYSLAAEGIATANATMQNCAGYSTASYGLSIASGIHSNCVGHSTANVGIRHNSNSDIYHCTATSTAASALWTRGNVYNCSIKCEWDNTAGHGITSTSPQDYFNVWNCTIEVTNASASCMNAPTTQTTYYGGNMFKGATTPVHSNITQGQTNTEDSYGNITHG